MYEEKAVAENNREKWACHKCKGEFQSDRDLANHVPECPVKFACEMCEKRYSYSSGLIRHRNRCHPDAEQPKLVNYVCELCGYLTDRKENFKRHSITVHGRK